MKIITYICGLIFLFLINYPVFSATGFGLYNLSIPDKAYQSNEYKQGNLNIKPENALLFAKISGMAYQSGLTAEDNDYIEDNGFQTTPGNSSIFYIYDELKFLPLTKNITIDGQPKKLVVLSFRGTQSTKDKLNDASYLPASFYDKTDLKVHGGFHDEYFKKIRTNESEVSISGSTLSEHINNSIKTGNTLFVLTGHSLGGAIAKLYAASLRERGVAGKNVLVYTYGAPPVGLGAFYNRYAIFSGAMKPINILESSNQLDPVFHISNLVRPLASGDDASFVHIGIAAFKFDKNGNRKPHSGCNPARIWGTNVIDSDWHKKLVQCDVSFLAHSLSTYIRNIYNIVDLHAISKQLTEDGQAGIIFTDSELLVIEMIITNPKYSHAFTGKIFDSTKLSDPLRNTMIQELKSSGLPIASKAYGALGVQIKLSLKNAVDKRKDELEATIKEIDSSQSLGLAEYEKLAFGSALNTVSAVSDILSGGLASTSKIVIKTPVIAGKLAKVASLSAKATPLMLKAIKLSQTKTFIFLKSLIEANFAVNDEIRGIIDTDAATAEMLGSVIGGVGQLSNQAIADKIKNKKAKLAVLFITKLNDIITAMLKGSTTAIITDQELKVALTELFKAVGELTPYAGPYYAQWNMGKKVSDQIADKPEVIDAWNKYFALQQAIQTEIRYVGTLGFIRKLDIIVSSALTQIKTEAEISAERAAQFLAEEEARKAEHDSYIDSLLKLGSTPAGHELVLNFNKNATYYELLMDSIEYGNPIKLIYTIGKIGEGDLVPVDANYDAQKGGFVFTLPTTEATSFYRIMIPGAPYGEGDTKVRYDSFDTYADDMFVNTVAGEFIMPDECPVGSTDIACEVGLHVANTLNLGKINNIESVGNYAYIASLQDGLKILDISNPKNPILKGLINQIGYVVDVEVVGNYAYIAGSRNGLKIFNISDPTTPLLEGYIDTDGIALDVEIAGKYAYIADEAKGLKIIDISDSTSPILVGGIDTTRAVDVEIVGDYAYVADGQAGFKIIDISDLSNLFLVGFLDTTQASDVEIIGDYAYLADVYEGLKIIDITNPENPILKGSFHRGTGTFGAYDVDIIGGYAYIASNLDGLIIVNISDPINPTFFAYKSESFRATGMTTIDKYIYLFNRDQPGLQIIDISNPINPSFKGIFNRRNGEDYVSIEYYKNKLYLSTRYRGLRGHIETYQVGTDGFPQFSNEITVPYTVKMDFLDDYIFTHDRGGSSDILKTNSLEKVGRTPLPPLTIIEDLLIFNNSILYVGYPLSYNENFKNLKLYDISDRANPVLLSEIGIDGTISNINKYKQYVLIDGWNSDLLTIMDASNASFPKVIKEFKVGPINSSKICNDNLYYIDYNNFLNIADLTKLPLLKSHLTDIHYTNHSYSLNCFDKYVMVGASIYDARSYSEPVKVADVGSIAMASSSSDANLIDGNLYVSVSGKGLFVYDFEKLLKNYQVLKLYKESLKVDINISLMKEAPRDYELETSDFIKTWTFSETINDFDIEVINTTYANKVTDSNFTKNGKTLSVNLTPDTSIPVNKLELKFTNNGNPVKINGSDTFWSLTRTNSIPRFADGQLTQMRAVMGESASLDIHTIDADGDTVTLSVEDADGGTVRFDGNNPPRLLASFNDHKTIHTLKIKLSDGKESVIKSIEVLRFDATSIQHFYSDVDPASINYLFSGIAFGTLKGVISGQLDPSNPQQRIFRPLDNASMAEALKMIVNAGQKAGLIQLPYAESYLRITPTWAMPYYTFARQYNALEIDSNNLASIYPSREEIAKLIVKVLQLDTKLEEFSDINAGFTDPDTFSDALMARYGNIAHFFGLFMTENTANAQNKVSRAELAGVIQKIFMMPSAILKSSADIYEQGDDLSLSLSNIKAEIIDSNYVLQGSRANVSNTYFNNAGAIILPLDTSTLSAGKNRLYSLLENNQVNNVVYKDIIVAFTDSDNDGLQDRLDAFPNNQNEFLDTDRDSLPDGWETTNKLNPLDPNDASQDADNDGLSNLEEYQAGSDPQSGSVHNSGCSVSDITIGSIQYQTNTTQKSQTGIMTNGSVVVKNSVLVAYQAPFITLKPGFHAKPGSQFSAKAMAISCITAKMLKSVSEPVKLQAGSDESETVSAVVSQEFSTWLNQASIPSPLRTILERYDAIAEDIQRDAEGQFISFSSAVALHELDNNAYADVYVYHSATESLALVSHDKAGMAGNGHSTQPRIDASGQFIVYQSLANNINVPVQDSNGVSDIYLYHIATDHSIRVSWQVDGAEMLNPAAHPAISAEDFYVVYDKADALGQQHIYGYDFNNESEKTVLYSLDVDDNGLLINSQQPTISRNGRYIAYLEISSEQSCRVHVYDRVSDDFMRTECPEGFTEDVSDWVPSFGVSDEWVHWYNTRTEQRLNSVNPLFNTLYLR